MKQYWRAAFILALALVVRGAGAESVATADFVIAQQATPLGDARLPNPRDPGSEWILVGMASQQLTLFDARGRITARYTVSTARLGAGEKENSMQTPRGWHRVCDKIGDGASPDTIIYHRTITPWRYTAALHADYPDKDWVLARILWLCGQEPGRNQGKGVDSHDRAIYIHGAGDHVAFGTPTSRGCVRMRTRDVIELYEHVPLGTDVLIDEAH